MSPVDIVVVSFNSAETLERCLGTLRGMTSLRVFVVDNNSSDESADVARRLGAEVVEMSSNGGFARGCNAGWPRGTNPYVLFLNPDSMIDHASLGRLVSTMEEDKVVGLAAPKIVDPCGHLDYSQRRFPRPASTFGRAVFAYRVFPKAWWADELVRGREAYEQPASPDWVSGACVLVRRSVLELLEGFDERFFMYCEDIDLCLRARMAGYQIRFVPDSVAVHVGGASAPRVGLIPMLALSRFAYAQKHAARSRVLAERAGLALEALTRAVLTRRGTAARLGHIHALRLLVFGPTERAG